MPEQMTPKQIKKDIDKKEAALDKKIESLCGLHKKIDDLVRKAVEDSSTISTMREDLARLREQLAGTNENNGDAPAPEKKPKERHAPTGTPLKQTEIPMEESIPV